MKKYNVKKYGDDFEFLSTNMTTKGTREKRIAIDKSTNQKAYFKYEKYNCSEACSEKMSYEIALALGYQCARIELARDFSGKLGVLNYVFIDLNNNTHDDAISYINRDSSKRNEYYTITNIKKCLDMIDTTMFKDFLKIMLFDALIGETDRHEENWGITKSKEGYKISPLYDNGCNLLRDFKKEDFANLYCGSNPKRSFDAYIKNATSYIYDDKHHRRYKLFKLIEYLYKEYPSEIEAEILNLENLTDEVIKKIVDQIPDDILTDQHKGCIIIYLKKRRDILKNIIKKEM